MKTKALSRRAALAGAISLAPAAAVAAVPIGADPDVELVALSDQVTALYERRLELQDLLAPYDAEYSERLYAACEQMGELQRKGELKAAHDLAVAFDRETQEARPPQVEAANEEADRITALLDAPAQRMFALPARTLRGLAIKAGFAAYEYEELWAVSFNDLDWHKKFVRHLIEEVLALAGEPLPFEAPDATADDETSAA